MMRIFTLLFAIILCGSANAQTYVWGGPGDANSEFDGGLNDWTTNWISPNENAVWYWDDDGNANQGAFSANNSPIESASVANGAAAFDSDFLDNGGFQDSIGTGGIAIAPQVSELISPEFSTMGSPEVSITWTQNFRAFQNNSFSVQVTNDGGATWTDYPIAYNNTWPVNAGSPLDKQISIDVSDSMGDQETVQFKFVYNANYYYWVIDDVAVIETPAVDIEAIDMYYPFNAATIPSHMLNSDTLEFALDITNLGTSDLASATASVEILDAAGTSVYLFTQETGMISAAGADTVEVVFDDVVLPADVATALATEGEYTILYDVVSNGEEDLFPDNNGLGEIVIVTPDTYSKTQTIITANSFNSGIFAASTVIRTGDLPDGMEYFTEDVIFNGATNSGSIANSIGNVALFKVLNQTGEEITMLFDEESISWGDLGDNPNLEFTGFGFFTAEGIPNFEDIPTNIFDVESEEQGVVLEENTTYILSYMWDISNEGETVFSSSSNRIDYFQPVNMVHIPEQGWFTIAEDLAWYMPAVIQARTADNTEIIELDENAVSVFPNPAVSQTTVELSFDEPTDATIILRDGKGGYISTTSVTGVTNQQVEIDLMNLPAGTYSFEITTSNSERAVKSFIKVQ